MSIHSAANSENPFEAHSNLNNPNPSMQAHSANIQHPPVNSNHQEWVAAYIDGQYYLTDPESMKRLKNIQNQIQQERSRLAKLEKDNSEYNHSFLSLQDERGEKQSNRSFCNTEFNENKQINKEEKVKNQLEKEEDRYKDKLKRMEKERSQMKRKMTPRADSKEKSYHKSRIQQSIKDNIELQKNENECEIKVSKPPSNKPSSKAEVVNPRSDIPLIQDSRSKKSERSQIKTKQPREDLHELQSRPESQKHSIKEEDKKISRSKISQQNNEHIYNAAGNIGFIPGVHGQVEEKQIKSGKPKSIIPVYESHVQELASIKSKPRERSIIQQTSVKQSTNQPYLIESEVKPASVRREKQPSEKIKQSSVRQKASVHEEKQLSEKIKQSSVKQPSVHEEKQLSEKIKQSSVKQASIHEEKQPSQKIKQSSVKQKSSQKQSSNKYNNIILYDDKKSRKSQSKSSRVSRKSDIAKIEESRANPTEQSNLRQQKQSIKSSVKESSVKQKSNKSEVRSIKDDVKSKKSEAKNTLNVQEKELKDQSCQYSRMTNTVLQSRAQQHSVQNISEKNSSFVEPQQQSIQQNQSFQNMAQSELKQEAVLQTSEHQVSPFKKKRQESVKDNQSQKKSKSFIIHSRNGSVKQRNESIHDPLNRSKISERRSVGKQIQAPSQRSDSVTKEQLSKLHEQIVFLRQKLKKVEERQEIMEKAQITLSKMKSNDVQEQEHQSPPSTPESPLLRLQDMNIGLRPQPKLHLESSIIQVDTKADDRKLEAKNKDAEQKAKLKQEISRLKKIIRDMQIEKIRSIDHDNELGTSGLLKKESKEYSQKESRISKEKDSLHSFDGMPTQRKFWGKSRIQDAGRIIKNNNPEPISPRKRSQQIKLYGNREDEVVVEPEDLPFQSDKKRSSKFINEAKNMSMIDRLHDKDRDFHQFMESSRMLAEDEHKREPTEQVQESPSTSFQHFSKISVSNYPEPVNKINYSRLVQQFKKPNPEEEQILPEIHLRDVKMHELPATPNPDLNQEELLSLAKKTYQVFGVDVDNEDKQLCVKKYKNCVVFTITTNSSECILWHFSGKFYMGGWKAGQPGEGEKHGEGLEIIPDKYIYKGQFLNGKKNGTGILKLANGNIYDGQWIQGLKNGRGVYLDAATRVIYSGEWKQGKKDGQGYLKLSDKEYYYGTFSKSVKEGFGAEVFVNGDKYKGEYKNGKFNGKGKYTWANGSCYQGQFVEGVRQGQGSWKSAKSNGDIYIGTYEADKKNGYGRYVWANGCMYEGGFANDVKHGKGRLTYQDGKEVKGVWSEGNLMKTQEKQAIEHEDQPLRRSMKANSFGMTAASSRRFVQ